MPSNLGQEPRQGKSDHARKRPETALDLELNLVFEEAGVFHHLMIKNKLVGEAGEDEVEEVDPDQRKNGKGDDLAWEVVAGPCRRENGLVDEGCCEKVIREGRVWNVGDELGPG